MHGFSGEKESGSQQEEENRLVKALFSFLWWLFCVSVLLAVPIAGFLFTGSNLGPFWILFVLDFYFHNLMCMCFLVFVFPP